MDDFLLSFQAAHDASMKRSYNQDYSNEAPNDSSSSLQRALNLFMYDSLDDISIDKLKAQRNKLIKTFHPDLGSDEDNQFAQKINEAYEVLKQYLTAKI